MHKLNNVAIFGMAKSGVSSFKLAKKLGFHALAVNEGNPSVWIKNTDLDESDLPNCFAQDEFAFDSVELIVLSPGIPTTHPKLKSAIEKQIPIISEIEFAYRYSKSTPVIAITGSNGKTTTTTMISEFLKKQGLKVFCGGNIGTPYTELPLHAQKVDVAVIEVSSFQLETCFEFHPKVALLLNLVTNHTERYSDIKDYARAKWRITQRQNENDYLVIGIESKYFSDWVHETKAQTQFFSKEHLPKEFLKHFDFSHSRLKGTHNQANFYCCYQAVKDFGVEFSDEVFQEFINEFKGVEHRLEYVCEYNNLAIYNDAKSTNAQATVTAINAFKNENKELYLVLAGKIRNATDQFLPDLLPYKKKITKIFLMGGVQDKLKEELSQDFEVICCEDLNLLKKNLEELKLQGNLVFSPGHPSFDQFKNYVDRGEQFKKKMLSLL